MEGVKILEFVPSTPPTFEATPASLQKDAENEGHAWEQLLHQIAESNSPDNAGFDDSILPIARLENQTAILCQSAQLLAATSSDQDVRQAAAKCQRSHRDIEDARFHRRRIFERIHAVYQQLDNTNLDPESRRLTEKWHRAYRYNGCGLDKDSREELGRIDRSITELKGRFRQTLVESTADAWFTEEELDGLPPNILESLERGNGTREGLLRIPFKKPMIEAVLKYVHRSAIRKIVFTKSEASCASNLQPFTEIMRLRQQRAKLLGYNSFSGINLSAKMAKDPDTILTFLDNLETSLKPVAEAELTRLKKLKQDHLATSTDLPPLDNYFLWDQPYYHEMHLKQSHQVDNQQLSEYFPLETVMGGMLRIFEELFEIKFEKVDAEKSLAEIYLTWHEDVTMYTVWECGPSLKESFIGYLYTDLFPRDGKYSHNANFNIQPGFMKDDGTRQPVATALVTNMPAPAPSKPSLLQHSQVVTLFHELGHAVHDLLSRTRYAAFHGHRVARDFVEMPSQLLENWCWLPDQLVRISGHYAHLSPAYAAAWTTAHAGAALPPQKLPAAMADALVAARGVDLALSTLRQIHLAKFDLFIHSTAAGVYGDVERLKRFFHESKEQIGLIRGADAASEDVGHNYVLSPHFVEGQASNYYSYLYGQVYSADIFQSAFAKEPRDAKVGRRYRKLILEPGGSRNPLEMIREFLGRAPSVEAFRSVMGITSSAGVDLVLEAKEAP